jgi:aspartate beta-hydroxylase
MNPLPSPVVALLTDAAAARQRGDPQAELKLLTKALAGAPGDPRILNRLGTHGLANGDPARARANFTAAAAADPGETTLWVNVATACRMQGDDAGERAALSQVLDIDRLHFIGQLRLAELNERVGRAREAAQGWSAVVQLAAAIDEPPPLIVDALARGRAFLAAHNAGLGSTIDTALGGRLAMLGSAARRFQACVDHSLGRRAIYQNQCAGTHFPFLPADEFFDRDLFPWLSAVEARTGAIRAEALALMAGGGAAIRPYVQMDKGSPETKWTALDGSLDWSACFLWEYGVRNDAVCDRCPETAAALDLAPRNYIKGKAPSAFFSILKPGAHIPAHTGVTNTRAIIHLPLVVPDGCRFRVGGETRVWSEGEAFAFDDTIEHEAWNDSAEPRIVLIFDVWNPHLTPDEQSLLQEFYALTDPR